MATPVWQPGTIYAPGSLVQPASAPAPQPDQVTNGGFELGNTGWTLDTGFTIGQFGNGTHFQGTWSLQWDLTGTGDAINDNATEVVPGQVINASCQVQQGASSAGQAGAGVRVLWYDASDQYISSSDGNQVTSTSNQNWKQSSVVATAPAGAAFARFCVSAFRNSGGDELWVDNCTWDAVIANLPTGLVFKAVQANAGYSGSSEPVWPLVNGQTVVDNEVTWEAVYATRVVWEAAPILVSGSYEPTWPTTPGGEVADGTIRWVAMTWRVTDENCPQGPVVAIEASKIFCADEDIIRYCATTNPLDWSSEEDAGYLPFGLKSYGAEPCLALGLYRSNLVAANGAGYQMWQVDEDPANMAYLDAAPVPCIYPKSMQPVSNDLVMLTPEGIRNIAIAGGSQNLQAGFFGAQVDPLVKPLLLAAIAAGFEPWALFWPAMGQYWLFFGAEAVVLTMNGGPKDQSWSRYVFPYDVTDWCLLDGDLYLRAGSLVWRVDEDFTADDVVCSPEPPVLSGELDELDAVLTWTAAEETEGAVDFYRLYNADTDALIAEVSGLTYTQTGLNVSEEYSYYVTSVGSNGGESEPSNTVTLNTPTLAAPVLSGEVQDIGGGNFTAALEWTASSPLYAVTGYKLYDASDDSLIATQPGLTYDDTPLGLGVEVSYYVRAYGPGGMSVPSNPLILDTGNEGTVIDIFTSDSTWTKRANLVSADVTVIGGGGGGSAGGGGPNTARFGGGGAGGGFASFSILAAFLGATESVTVGAGGAGSPSVQSSGGGTPSADGSDGGSSAFGAWATAGGGEGGKHNPGTGAISTAAGGVGDVTASPGPTSIIEESGGRGCMNTTPPGSCTYAGAGGAQGAASGGTPESPGTSTNSGTNYFGGNGGAGAVGVQNGNAPAGTDGTDWGGGGGGGGAAGQSGGLGPFSSGAGGNGGAGVVVVVNHLAV